MKRADEAVEKVMSGLRDVEAASGLERRVLAGVERRVAGRRSVGFPGGWRWVGVCCAVLVLVGVGTGVWRMGRHDAAGSASARGVSGRAGRHRVGEIERGGSQRLKPSVRWEGYGTAEAVPLRKASAIDRSRGRDGGGRERLGHRRDEGVVSDQAAVSDRGMDAGFPAPPLPLTSQERLLQRVARHGEPVPAVAVEVASMPSEDADETAEFQRFFGKPERVEQVNQKVNQGESR